MNSADTKKTASPDAPAAALVSNPLRMRCWIRLAEQPRSPIQLSEEFGVPLKNVNYHVDELRKLGAIELVGQRRVRGAAIEHFYRSFQVPILDEVQMRELTVEEATGTARLITQIAFVDIQNALDQRTFCKRAEHASVRIPMVADEAGWEALKTLFAEMLDRVLAVRAESSERLTTASDGEARISTTTLLYCFETPHAEAVDETAPATHSARDRAEAPAAAVVSNPLRMRCWIRLAEQTRSPMQLSKEFGFPLNNIKYHVDELRRLGAIELVGQRTVRGALQSFYRSVQLPLLDEAQTRELTVEEATGTARLITQIAFADIQNALDQRTFCKRAEHAAIRVPMVVDVEGWQTLSHYFGWMLDQVLQVRAESKERIAVAPDGEVRIPATALLFCFETPHAETVADGVIPRSLHDDGQTEF